MQNLIKEWLNLHERDHKPIYQSKLVIPRRQSVMIFRLLIKTKKSCRKGKSKRVDRSRRIGDFIGQGFLIDKVLFLRDFILATNLSKKYVRDDA